jgi:hypothetical protein
MTGLSFLAACLAVLLAVAAVTPGLRAAAAAQESTPPAAPGVQHDGHHDRAEEPPAAADVAVGRMPMRQRMMAARKAADARLEELLARMNATTGDAKVAAMAAVIAELVQQRKAMHSRMDEMERAMPGGAGMMPHAGAH